MIPVLLSAILFGLVHPGSKLLMDQGIGLLSFCILYVSIRLFAQVPIVLLGSHWKINGRSQAFCLVSLGLIGAALQFSEFYGVSVGLPVSVVTFLVYTHPVWTLLLSRLINKEKITLFSVGKITSALVGTALITGVQLAHGYSFTAFIFPLVAGLMIALWITVSNQATKQGCSTKTISFYYDLFCFAVLMGFALISRDSNPLNEAIAFSGNIKNLGQIAFYSIFIGLLPNYLFYFGSKTVPAVTAGLVLLFEPVFSASISSMIWNDPLSPMFVVGALAILSTNIPQSAIQRLVVAAQSWRSSNTAAKEATKVAFAIAILFFVSTKVHGSGSSSVVHIIEVAPSDPTDYTVSAELHQIEYAADMATSAYKSINPSCQPVVKKLLKRGTEEELASSVRAIANQPGGHVLLGFSRTNFARVAAKAAQGSKLLGISTGASASNLREINQNFVSIVSPWIRQANSVMDEMKKNGCTDGNTTGVFDEKNYLSNRFSESYQQRGKFTASLRHGKDTLSELAKLIGNKKCVFIPLNFSDAQAYVHEIIHSKWKGNLYGVGDWNYYSVELKKSLSSAKYPGLVVFVPTGWIPSASRASEQFAKLVKQKLNEAPSPVGAYAFDATLLALDHACRGLDPIQYEPKKLGRLPLLREYENIGETGNYLSPVFSVTFKSGG
ncbi:MAG: EamA family transporter [Bacteriovoracia bacterium]